MTKEPAELLAPWIEKARQTVASTGDLHEAIGSLALEIMEHGNEAGLAAIALIQLAADEDFSGVTQ